MTATELRALAAGVGLYPTAVQTECCDCGDVYPCGHGCYAYALRFDEVLPANRETADRHGEKDYHSTASEVCEFPPGAAEWMVAASPGVVLDLLDEIDRLRAGQRGGDY